MVIAAEAGLAYADLDRTGITRRRRGRGFSYVGPRGGKVDPSTRRRIDGLAIPPAWRDVWIASDPRSHILAAGTDDAGRRQYLYHPRFRAVADEIKFARIGALGDRITDVRRAVCAAIDGDDDHARLIAIVVRLIDVTLMRVGSERYAAENESFGASTLRCGHARVQGRNVNFCFVGKGGEEQTYITGDADVLAHVRTIHRRARGDALLFAASDGWTVDGSVVADWLSNVTRLDVTAKDLRTFGASASMVRALVDLHDAGTDRDPIVEALDTVAERLRDTRAVTRSSYIAPQVTDAFERGELAEIWAASRRAKWRSREESALTKLLSV